VHLYLHARQSVAAAVALAEGCQAIGHTVVWQRPSVWRPDMADARASCAAVYGLAGRNADIRATYRARGVPVWILELPRLRTEPDAMSLLHDSLAWLPDAPNGRPVVAPAVIAGRVPETTLVIGQKPNDAAHGMDAGRHRHWVMQTIAWAREAGRPVVFRPHPKDWSATASESCGADAVSLPANESLHDALSRAACVVVYNSTVGWDAIAAGVPVVTRAPRESVAYRDYLSDDLTSPVALTPERRAQALARCASTQWTMDELRCGIAASACFDGAPFPVATPAEGTPTPPTASSSSSRRARRRRLA
jgi:hypothetical protein